MGRATSENTQEGWNATFGGVSRSRGSKTATGLGGFFSGVFSSNARFFFFLDNGRYLCYSNQEKASEKFKKLKGVIDLAQLRQSPYNSTYGVTGRPHGTKEILLHYGDYEINLECKDSQEQQTWIGHIEGLYNRLQQEIADGLINLETEVFSTRGEYKAELIPPTLVALLLSKHLKQNTRSLGSSDRQELLQIVHKYMGEEMAGWLYKQPVEVVSQRLHVFQFNMILKKTDSNDQVAFLKGKLGLAADLKPIKCVCILLTSRNLVGSDLT